MLKIIKNKKNSLVYFYYEVYTFGSMNICFMKCPVYLQPSFLWRQEWTKIRQNVQRKLIEGIKYKEILLLSVLLRKYKKTTTKNISLCHVLLEHVKNWLLMPGNLAFALHILCHNLKDY